MAHRGILNGLSSVILIAALILYINCGRREEPASGPAGLGQKPDSAADPRKHFELTKETVVLGNATTTVRNVSNDRTEYTLDSSADEIRNLAPGKVLLIPGVDAGRVREIRQEGDNTIVKLEAVRITDIIRNGTLKWGPENADTERGFWVVHSEGTNVALLDPRSETGDFQTALWNGGTAAPVMTAATGKSTQTGKIDLTVGDYKISIRFKTDTVNFTFTQQSGQHGGVGLWSGGSVEVKWGKPVSSGAVTVRNGSLQNYTFTMPVDGYAKLDITTKSSDARTFPEAALVELPAQWVVPVNVYGLPCYIGLGTKFLIQPSIAAKETGIGIQLRADFNGDLGFHYMDGSLQPSTNLNVPEPENPLSGIIAVPSVGSLALLFAAQAPRISFGVGVNSLVSTGVFVDLVTSVGVTVAGATSMVPCRQITLSQVAGTGIEYEIGPEGFQALLKNLKKEMKLKVESKKFELFRKDRHWYSPNIKGCAPG